MERQLSLVLIIDDLAMHIAMYQQYLIMIIISSSGSSSHIDCGGSLFGYFDEKY